jgi:hypothetical protein
VERLWFLRADGEWLRPVADNTWTYLELFQPFPPTGSSQVDARSALAKVLLTPSAVAENPDAFTRLLPDLFGLACEVAGDRACYEALGALQDSSPAEHRGAVCRFLAGYLDQCSDSECYPGVFPLLSTKSQRSQPKMRPMRVEEVKRALESGDKDQIKQMTEELHMLSCNRDLSVRQSAQKELLQYFPDDPPIPCVRCR